MKHTEQDQPIHVNADRQDDGWIDDLGPDYPFGTNTSYEGWDTQTEDPCLADELQDNMRICRRDEAYAAIASDVPEWHDDAVFVDWYIERVTLVHDNIADAREYIDREYREYLDHMCDGKEEA